MNKNEMTVIQDMYADLIDWLAEKHDRWVKQNFRLRGMELAMRQVHDEGDIQTDYVMQIIKENYETLIRVNEETRIEMDNLRNFVIWFLRQVEDRTGEKIDNNEVRKIYGY